MQPYRALIFDMDGLMVDTEPLSHQAWNELLRPFGHQLSDAQVQQIIGLRAEMSSQFMRDQFGLPLTTPQIMARKAALQADICAAGVPPMPGLLPLHAVIAARQIPWGVATSSPRAHAQMILAQLGLSPTRGALAAGNEVQHGKPAPDIYLLAASRLGIPAESCIALEDSGPGSQAAKAAGMFTIAIPNVHTKTADFRHVDRVLGGLAEVIPLLDELLTAVHK